MPSEHIPAARVLIVAVSGGHDQQAASRIKSPMDAWTGLFQVDNHMIL